MTPKRSPVGGEPVPASPTGATSADAAPIFLVKRKGRGAVTNLPHRFESTVREADGDSLDADLARAESDGNAPLPAQPTTVTFEHARSLLAYNDSPDIPFDRSINPYRGCEHGCIYCYARPTHSFLNLSPGLDFETRLVAKRNAVDCLRAELAVPSYRPAVVNIGSATDAYQPIERDLRLTRGALELLVETQHPLSVVTKSSLVERDVDLLRSAAICCGRQPGRRVHQPHHTGSCDLAIARAARRQSGSPSANHRHARAGRHPGAREHGAYHPVHQRT